ncbi:MAG: hypothetical protein ACYTKD_04605 [Planctomycetota bacterium]|jgi:hypothetical protein
MLDKGEFKKRLLLRLVTRPSTLVPLLVGATIMLLGWGFGVNTGLLLFAAVACVLGAFGMFFTKLILGDDAMANSIIESMQEDANEERESGLDELDEKLVEDGDPRTEECLRDLRALAKAFNESRAPAAKLSSRCTLDIASGVEKLFERCVQSLKQTLDLWRTADRMVTPDAKKPVLEQRERMIADVRKSIGQLGEVLAGLQSLRAGEGSSSELARIREELDERLTVAKKVEERMRSLERQLDPGQAERPGA